jgi:hypothetical protein
MVTNVSEHRLIMLFIEGISKPLHVWFKAFKLASLQDSIIRMCDKEDAVPKNKFPSKPFLLQK